jgi:hypothetical protein
MRDWTGLCDFRTREDIQQQLRVKGPARWTAPKCTNTSAINHIKREIELCSSLPLGSLDDLTMTSHIAKDTTITTSSSCTIMDGDAGGDELNHLNNSNNEEEQQHIINNREKNHWLFRRGRFQQCNKKKVVMGAVAIGLLSLFLVVVSMATKEAIDNRKRIADSYFPNEAHPSAVERWLYYNGAYFKYGLYLQQRWPNPDPTMLILYGGGWSAADFAYLNDFEDDTVDYTNPNNLSFMDLYGSGGGWAVGSGTPDDGSSCTLEYSVPSGFRQRQGGTISFNGVEYTNLKKTGSVFLVSFDFESNESKVTQLSGIDVSSLVIDQETMSIASVTAFCNAHAEILDFFDSTRKEARIKYNNNRDDGDA